MRIAFLILLVAFTLLACDRIPPHRFIVSEPVPDQLYVQYSNPECAPFPVVKGAVMIEYDQKGCACTSTPENGERWGENAFNRKMPDGHLEVLEHVVVIEGSTSHYDDILQINVKIIRDKEAAKKKLALFLERCSHLPNVNVLLMRESISRMLEYES